MITVCMISSLHGLYDDRIYWKESLTLKNHGYSVVHIGVGIENMDFISEHGIRLIMVGKKKYFSDPYLDILFRKLTLKSTIYERIFNIAADLKADVYHFHDLQLNRIGKKLKELPHSPKVVYDVHEPFPVTIRTLTSRNPLITILSKIRSVYIHCWELKKAGNYDLIIATENIVAAKFSLKTKVKTEIVYNYTDLNEITNTDINEHKEFDGIYCGGIRSIRGVFQIIEVSRLLLQMGKPVKILLIGPISEIGLKTKILKSIERKSLRNYVFLKDPVPYTEVNKYYRQAKIGLLLFEDNQLHRTILPIKVFEYMSFGLPILGSNFGHIQDYIQEGRAGLTVNPSNPVEIAEAFLKLLENNDLYESLSRNGRMAAAEKYSWKIMGDKILEIYSNLLMKQ
jgi:glycosyltransferase involved in cell wall biosynthesis